jgi:hypothetical protein
MPPYRWRDAAFRLTMSVLSIALMLYIAARLVIAVLPVLIVAGTAVLVGFVGWSVYQFRRSRW